MIMTEAYQSAFNMVNKWLNDGEVSGTDHYIGKDYDEEEFANLRLIRALLFRELRYQLLKDEVIYSFEKVIGVIKEEEEAHDTTNQES